ncbi:hypothetical protein [Bdellovibrio bacteriovorus]|uniref:hypothetical protein n=1 Tax=Bdellovibrio bacteriovorus TaxID=959 RepID=UPI0035A69DC0
MTKYNSFESYYEVHLQELLKNYPIHFKRKEYDKCCEILKDLHQELSSKNAHPYAEVILQIFKNTWKGTVQEIRNKLMSGIKTQKQIDAHWMFYEHLVDKIKLIRKRD